MGKLLRLTDVTLTDTTAPRIAHSAGVAGAMQRFIAEHVLLSDGAKVGAWDDYQGGPPAKPWIGSPVGPILGTDSATGYRFLDHSSTVAAGSQLKAGSSVSGPVTLAVVVNTPANSSKFVSHNGYTIARAANGQFSIAGSGNTGNYGGPTTLGWRVLVATFDGANSALLTGDTTVAGTNVVANANPGDFQLGDYQAATGAKLAEVIKWPRALTADERLAVRTALLKRYPAAV